MGSEQIMVTAVRDEHGAAIADLIVAQERRWRTLDAYLPAARSVEQARAVITRHPERYDTSLVALNAQGKVRGYARLSLWELPPEDGLRAFFTARNGLVEELALPDPADVDALTVASSLLVALTRQWNKQQTLGNIFRWPCCDQWLDTLLQRNSYMLDSDFAYHSAQPLRPTTRPPSPHVSSRLARFADEPALVALFTEELLFHEPYTPFVRMSSNAEFAFRQRLANAWERKNLEAGGPVVVVVEYNGEVVAMSENELSIIEAKDDPALLPAGRYGYLNNVSVHQKQRGQGIGRALVQATFDVFSLLMVDGFYLWFNPDNPLANSFWPHMEFHSLWRTYQQRH
ncbi:GNAT family N-acetyltransferase [Dictyobacter arantiisoli]|uniref:N-acetyltransferase domain-containing protein n=1 Tax=Dictyobacter arantiisoli TaxID=2014874 RepID=A0A5A5TIV5_9CHLR|nr:GNAT family N-acetyltransferase [Dictyobacter arantiisoli]GCF11540.1 hypothetical protein KDI_51040 [Dictyobacter arantiisoli]